MQRKEIAGYSISKVATWAIIIALALGATVFYMFYTGRFGGWWILIIGIFAAIHTFKFHKAWKEQKEFEVEKAQLRQDL